MVACATFWTVGAWFGGNLAVSKRNVRLAAVIGCLLMLPFTWSYWAFIHRPSTYVGPCLKALTAANAPTVVGTG